MKPERIKVPKNKSYGRVRESKTENYIQCRYKSLKYKMKKRTYIWPLVCVADLESTR